MSWSSGRGEDAPGDVEVGAVAGGRAVLQDVVPPGVLVGADAHVVGHGVEDLAQPGVAQGGDPGLVVLLGADLGVEAAVVDDVVAVRAAGPGLQVRRGIAVGDAQVAQVGHDGRGVAEGEAGVELEAVGRFGPPRPRRPPPRPAPAGSRRAGFGSMVALARWSVIVLGWSGQVG